jgi:hypothetical protein
LNQHYLLFSAKETKASLKVVSFSNNYSWGTLCEKREKLSLFSFSLIEDGQEN